MHVMYNVDLQRVRVHAEERIKTITPQKLISFFSKNFSKRFCSFTSLGHIVYLL